MTYDEWRAQNNICPTCGKILTSSIDSFRTCMRRLGRPPLHCKGHNPHKKGEKYQAEYKAFKLEKHFCACGCGEILEPDYRAFVASMIDYGRGPIRKKNHHKNRGSYNNGLKKEPEVFNRHGCRIVLTKHSSRCDRYGTCEYFNDCLGFAVMEKKQGGWMVI